MLKRCFSRFPILVFITLSLAVPPTFSQKSNWTGQAQCQLTVQSQGFVHQEVQTWTLTGGPPTQQGAMQIYPGTWSVIGQGSAQRPTLLAQWNSNVPAMNAPIDIFIRASDNRLVIKSWHAQLVAPAGTIGVRQISGTQTSTPSAVYEWIFPQIEAEPNAETVTGTGTIVVPGNSIAIPSASASGVANCKWQFSRGGQAVPAMAIRTTTSPMLTGATSGMGAPANAGAAAVQTSGAAGGGAASAGTQSTTAGAAAYPAGNTSVAVGGSAGGAGAASPSTQGTAAGAAAYPAGNTSAAAGGGAAAATGNATGVAGAAVLPNSSTGAAAGGSPGAATSTAGTTLQSTTQPADRPLLTSVSNPAMNSALLPHIVSVVPNQALQNARSFSVTLTGSNTHFVQGQTTADFGPGITVRQVTVATANNASATIDVDPNADTKLSGGLRSVTVTTAAEVLRMPSAFTVVPNTAPMITQIAPSSGFQGTTIQVAITGRATSFSQGSTIASFGPGITVSNLSVTSPTTASAQVTIDPTATANANDLTVTTGSESVSLPSAFGIVSIPRTAHMSPTTAQQQQSTMLTVTGIGTHFKQGVTLITFDGGYQGLVSVLAPDRAVLYVPSMRSGVYDVSLQTAGEVAKAGSFTLAPAPDAFGHSLDTATRVPGGPGYRSFPGVMGSATQKDCFQFTFDSSYPSPDPVTITAYGNGSTTYSITAFNSDKSFWTLSNGAPSLTLRAAPNQSAFACIEPIQWDVWQPNVTVTFSVPSQVQSTAPPPQTNPLPFSFIDKRLAVPYETYTSGYVLIQGINMGVPIYVENGGLYSINGGAYTQQPGLVYNGDRISLQGDIGATDISRYYIVHVGGSSAGWKITMYP